MVKMIIDVNKEVIYRKGQTFDTSHCAEIGQMTNAANVKNMWLHFLDLCHHWILLAHHDITVVRGESNQVFPRNIVVSTKYINKLRTIPLLKFLSVKKKDIQNKIYTHWTYIKTCSRWSNIFWEVPTLQIGMSKNRVTAWLSKYRTSIARVFSEFLSLLSSQAKENGFVLQFWTTSLWSWGARAFLTIMVVFVRPQANFLAIWLSENMDLQSLVKWSATANGMLCSAIKFENKNSAFTTPEIKIILSDQLNVLENINNKYVFFAC